MGELKAVKREPIKPSVKLFALANCIGVLLKVKGGKSV
jgi:hypothetical protein